MVPKFDDYVADNVFAGHDGAANARPGLQADLDVPSDGRAFYARRTDRHDLI